MNKKPCTCTFCMQFYFNRIENYKYNKNNKSTKLVVRKIINNVDLDQKNNNPSNKNKTFTLSDLENITLLKSLECDTDEISKQTNLSYSMVEYVIKMISW